MKDPAPTAKPLRVFCIEDNPLIVLHLEMLVEELGHVFVGSSDSFKDIRSRIDGLDFDVALVDIDLADGRTGGEVVTWLNGRSCPSILVTGQEQLAARYADVSVGLIVKPVTADILALNLQSIPRHDRPGT